MLSDLGRGRGRIGAMVPSTNRNLEPDFFLLAPPGVSVHFVRLREENTDELPTSAVLQRYAHLPVAEPAELLVPRPIPDDPPQRLHRPLPERVRLKVDVTPRTPPTEAGHRQSVRNRCEAEPAS